MITDDTIMEMADSNFVIAFNDGVFIFKNHIKTRMIRVEQIKEILIRKEGCEWELIAYSSAVVQNTEEGVSDEAPYSPLFPFIIFRIIHPKISKLIKVSSVMLGLMGNVSHIEAPEDE